MPYYVFATPISICSRLESDPFNLLVVCARISMCVMVVVLLLEYLVVLVTADWNAGALRLSASETVKLGKIKNKGLLNNVSNKAIRS